MIYESNGWEVDLARRELRARGIPVPLGKRAFQVFAVLVQSAGQLVTKDELMARVWPSVIVEENTLEVHISAIRRALGTDRESVKTSSGRGYRLVGDWTIRNKGFSRETVDLDSSPMPVRPFLNNVPAAGSVLIGRHAAVQHLQNFLSAYRAITLTGPGGIGKTALALEVTRTLFPTFAGDCWLVDLASLSDPQLVPSMVASVLGVRLAGDESSGQSVARAIGARKLLLVLDNCEHVIDAAARMAETVLHLCPATSIIATSREALRIEGEHVYRVSPLDVPNQQQEESDIVLRHGAVQLFVARAQSLDSEFLLHGEELRAIAAICRRLDGIPLALEIAAARVDLLGVRELAAHLDDHFLLLTKGRRTAAPRHQTLFATMDWSFELLSDAEQTVLRRLSVFSRRFTIEAAIAVAADDDITRAIVIEAIQGLINQSLLTTDCSSTVAYYKPLHVTRIYAAEKLLESGDWSKTSRQHAIHVCNVLKTAEADWELVDCPTWIATYGPMMDDIRVALKWAYSSAGEVAIGTRLTAAALPVGIQLSLIDEFRRLVARALESIAQGPSSLLEAEIRLNVAHAALGEFPKEGIAATVIASEKAEELFSKTGNTICRFEPLVMRATLELDVIDYNAALETANRLSVLAQSSSDPVATLISDRMMSLVLHFAGNHGEARALAERVNNNPRTIIPLAYSQVTGRRRGSTGTVIARVLWLEGYSEQAAQASDDYLERAYASGPSAVCQELSLAACPIALWTGDYIKARTLIDLLLAQGSSNPVWSAAALSFDAVLSPRECGLKKGDGQVFDYFRNRAHGVFQMDTLGTMAEELVDAEAITRAQNGQSGWCTPEILRVKGENIACAGGALSTSVAEATFLNALSIARQQGALAWELRAATSLARLRQRDFRFGAALDLLAPIYHRFTEGHGTRDLIAASTLLAELESQLSCINSA